MDHRWIAIVATIGILSAGTHWVTAVVELYRTSYFAAEDPVPYKRSRAALVGWLIVQFLATYLLGLGQPPVALPAIAVIIVALQGVIVTDLRYKVIPDRFQLTGLIGALGYTTATLPSLSAFAAQATVGITVPIMLWLAGWLYSKLRRRDAMGFGDIKLIAWLGIVFGAQTLDAIFYSLLTGAGVMGSVWIIKRCASKDNIATNDAFAFGPFIVAGCCIHLLSGPQALQLLEELQLWLGSI